MAVNFGILAQTPSIGARYAEGLQLAQAEQERNMLRQQQMAQLEMQRENMLAQRADREAQRGEREAQARLRGQQELELKARMERAAREEGYLNKVSELFANNGMPLNLKTAQEGLSYAIKSGDKSAIDMMNRTVASLQEREALQAAFGGQAAPAAPAAAPVNALAAPPQPTAPAAGAMGRQQLQDIILNPNAPPAAVERAKAVLATLPKEPTPRAPQLMTPEEEAQRIRIALASRPPPQPREPREPAVRTTKVELADGSIGVMNLDTGAITPATVGGQPAKGKPSAFAEKAAAQRKQLATDLDRTISELTEATKKGGLIDQATGSGIGRVVDVGAGFFGKATPGAIAIGKLAPIADMVLKMVPRFEGPQSDKDTKSYKEAAGQLADASMPNEIRKQAALEILRLMKARKGEFATADMAPETAAPARAPATGVDTSNPLLK